MPSEEQKTALKALKLAATGPDVTVMTGIPKAPAAIAALATKPNSAGAKSALASLVNPLANDALNNESKLLKAPGYNKLENWASGGAPFKRFKDAAITDFFDDLFKHVSALTISVAKGQGQMLARNDLFHGHLVFDDSDPKAIDILMLFHGREYPSDLESAKSGFAAILEPAVKPFSSSGDGFKRRNTIYSLKKNALYNLNFAANTNPYKVFLADTNIRAGNPFRLEQDNLGFCLADVNTFPHEGATENDVSAFLKLW